MAVLASDAEAFNVSAMGELPSAIDAESETVDCGASPNQLLWKSKSVMMMRKSSNVQ